MNFVISFCGSLSLQASPFVPSPVTMSMLRRSIGPVTRSAAKRGQMPDQPKPPEGPWISSLTSTSGNGASVPFVQEKVEEWLGLVTLVEIPDPPVLIQEECSLIAVALEHEQLYNDRPITPLELLQIAEDEEVEDVCVYCIQIVVTLNQQQHLSL